MQLQGKALRIVIYAGESDRYKGKSLSMALLEFLKREGASGATVTRGLAGFGARSRIHTATIVDLSSDLPIRIEWVDNPEVVERLLPQVRRMVDDGLITVDEVDVVQYAPGRRPDPLAQPVRDVMRQEIVTVKLDTPAADIVTLLLRKKYRSLPVVDEAGRLQGIITDGDLLRRTDLAARLDLQAELPEASLQQQLFALQEEKKTAAEIMTQPVVTLRPEETLGEAARRMAAHRLKRLPVVDEGRRLTGWVSRVDVLRTIEYHRLPEAPAGDAPAVDAVAAGATVAELMHRDAPSVGLAAELEEILQVLEASRQRRVTVVDEAGRVAGIITDGDLLRRSRRADRQSLLARLRRLITRQPRPAPALLPGATETAAALMTTPVITIGLETPLHEALRLMLQHKIKRLPVVDEEGRLAGLLGRASLLQGLLGMEREADQAES